MADLSKIAIFTKVTHPLQAFSDAFFSYIYTAVDVEIFHDKFWKSIFILTLTFDFRPHLFWVKGHESVGLVTLVIAGFFQLFVHCFLAPVEISLCRRRHCWTTKCYWSVALNTWRITLVLFERFASQVSSVVFVDKQQHNCFVVWMLALYFRLSHLWSNILVMYVIICWNFIIFTSSALNTPTGN